MCPNSRNVVKRVRLEQTMVCGFGNVISKRAKMSYDYKLLSSYLTKYM